jgi:hypothetical protein
MNNAKKIHINAEHPAVVPKHYREFFKLLECSDRLFTAAGSGFFKRFNQNACI